MEKFIQEFKQTGRGSEYEDQALIKEFKREMSRHIQKIMKVEQSLRSID